jgi:hypothetical protein
LSFFELELELGPLEFSLTVFNLSVEVGVVEVSFDFFFFGCELDGLSAGCVGGI